MSRTVPPGGRTRFPGTAIALAALAACAPALAQENVLEEVVVRGELRSQPGVAGWLDIRGTPGESSFRGMRRLANRGNYPTPIGAFDSSELLEAGLKGSLFGNALYFALARYRQERTDYNAQSIVNNQATRTDGVEFEMRWIPGPRWLFTLSYTNMEAINGTYNFGNGVAISASAVDVDAVASGLSGAVTLPAYTLRNLGVVVDRGSWTFNLTARNITDERYFRANFPNLTVASSRCRRCRGTTGLTWSIGGRVPGLEAGRFELRGADHGEVALVCEIRVCSSLIVNPPGKAAETNAQPHRAETRVAPVPVGLSRPTGPYRAELKESGARAVPGNR